MSLLPIALALPLLLSQAPKDASSVLLAPGAQVTLEHPGLSRVAVADPQVADVMVVGKSGQLLVTGRRKGRTTLTLWGRGGKVSAREVVVDDGRAAELARLVRETVNPSLTVRSAPGKVVIDGSLDSMEEYERLRKLTEGESDVVVLAKLHPGVLRALAAVINEAYDKAGLKSARAVVVGERLFLEGQVADEVERQKAQTIAEAYYEGFDASGAPSSPAR